MSIEQTESVDGLGTDKSSGAVVLTISDHLPWDEAHLSTLEAKLASYIHFIKSGQLVESRPDASARKVEIQVVCLYRPTQSAESFLAATRAAVNERGIGFSYGPIPNSGYSEDHG